MLLYRVFPHLPSAGAGESGDAMYLHRPQGQGRLDNPDRYDTWYFGQTPETAVGESFANLTVWRSAMFAFPALPGASRALGIFELQDDARILDLDDANALRDRALRPTQVIARNRPVTQGWARSIFDERAADGSRKWDGIRWWSYHRPHWTVIALWNPPGEQPVFSCVDVEPLTLTHPAVVDAARSLGKQIVP